MRILSRDLDKYVIQALATCDHENQIGKVQPVPVTIEKWFNRAGEMSEMVEIPEQELVEILQKAWTLHAYKQITAFSRGEPPPIPDEDLFRLMDELNLVPGVMVIRGAPLQEAVWKGEGIA